MRLGAPVQIRLAAERQLVYEQEAAARGLPLATWLRHRLDGADQVTEELAALHDELRALRAAVEQQHQEGREAAILEALLLLRAHSSPSQLKSAQAELARNGFVRWTGSGSESG
jgi:hypothetical protein